MRTPMLQRKTPRPGADSALAGPGARRSPPRGGRGGLGRLGRPPRRGIKRPPPPPAPHRGPEGRGSLGGRPVPLRRRPCLGVPVSMVTPVQAAGAGGREAAASPRQTEGAAGTRRQTEPEREPTRGRNGSRCCRRSRRRERKVRRAQQAPSRGPGFVGGQDARGRAPCSGPRRRGRPLAHRLLAGPANPGWASASDGCARGRGARRGAAELGALPRC